MFTVFLILYDKAKWRYTKPWKFKRIFTQLSNPYSNLHEPIYPLYNLVFEHSIEALISFKSQGRWTCAGHNRVGLVMSRSKVCVRPRSQVKLGRQVGY